MKILLACSCLEPGLDGVGDYTRRLAAELQANGNETFLLALADGRTENRKAAVFLEAGENIPALRLPATASWAQRVMQAQEFRRVVGPDLVSWQIVPYGFDPRGLSFGLGARLREISGECATQVMFHEIWIGSAREARLRQKLVGKVQRHIIGDMLRRLKPRVIHTHMPLYRHLLGKRGHPAKILPLFGNIPIADAADPAWLRAKRPDLADRAGWWVFVLFGSIHPEWDADDFRRRALAAAAKAGKKCLLIAIGRAGVAGEEKLRQLAESQGDAWQVLALGSQPEAEISQCLLAADFGVTSSPPENVFKSGTVAAMIEHGLHVIVTRPPAHYPGCPPLELTAGMRNVITNFEIEGVGKTSVGSLLPEVAGQFLDDIDVGIDD